MVVTAVNQLVLADMFSVGHRYFMGMKILQQPMSNECDNQCCYDKDDRELIYNVT